MFDLCVNMPKYELCQNVRIYQLDYGINVDKWSFMLTVNANFIGSLSKVC